MSNTRRPVSITESDVENAALVWLEGLGWAARHGPAIAPGEMFAERGDNSQVILPQRLRDALLPKLISGELRVKGAKNLHLQGRFITKEVATAAGEVDR